jgi:hypothetical protein
MTYVAMANGNLALSPQAPPGRPAGESSPNRTTFMRLDMLLTRRASEGLYESLTTFAHDRCWRVVMLRTFDFAVKGAADNQPRESLWGE